MARRGVGVAALEKPSEPMSVFAGSGRNMFVGGGSLIVADANGKHLDNPPSDPSSAYFYLFYNDLSSGAPGPCARFLCTGIARARYADVIMAALLGDPHKVATVFHKYDGPGPIPGRNLPLPIRPTNRGPPANTRHFGSTSPAVASA
jgi:hypothetical protein